MFSRDTSMLSLGWYLLLLKLALLILSAVVINWFAILLLIFVPSLCALAQLSLSRTHDFDANLGVAQLADDAGGLANALANIEPVQGGWMERIFMPGSRVLEPSLLPHPRTHQATCSTTNGTEDGSVQNAMAPIQALDFDMHSVFGNPVKR